MNTSPKIAIVGAGPGGLSLARLLVDNGLSNVTVFEKQPRVGGKSWTFYAGGAVAEMGTCYTTLSHALVKKWMKRHGMTLRRNGVVKFDGEDFLNYVKKGAGPPFSVQALRYFWDGWRLRRALEAPNPPQSVIDEAAMPILDWLRERKLPKVELFLHRIITIMGYGFLDEVSAVQAHRWCDITLFVSGATNQLHMPVEGWSELWVRLSQELDVRTDCPVTAFERHETGVSISTPQGEEAFDWLVCATPLDEFIPLGESTAEEQFVRDSVEWQGYTTTLLASDNWFSDWHVEGYSDTVKPGAPLGKLVGARLEAFEPELGGNLYVTGQLSRDLSEDELREIAISDLTAAGVNVTNVVMQKSWKYFAQYKLDAVKNGLLATMRDMQGAHRTWYTGSTFSHEAVSHVVNFNVELARQMAAKLLTTPRAHAA